MRLAGKDEGVRVPTFFELFAGGGMVRAGLAPTWRCLFANDFDHKKASTYRRNWGGGELLECDVRKVELEDLPNEVPDLIWASFPCQDLSLAGGGAGLRGDRSGAFRPFWTLIRKCNDSGRAPSIIVLENVCGTLTSSNGGDFQAIVGAFREIGFKVGAIVIDAELFVPQSRKRLFFIGVPEARSVDKDFELASESSDLWHPSSLKRAYMRLPQSLKKQWIWWGMPSPAARNMRLADLLESEPKDVVWDSPSETRRLLAMMAKPNLEKVEMAKAARGITVGTMYRRTRSNSMGESVQRVEARFDNVAGCLRTPSGGSSRQRLLIVEDGRVRSRLMSARETARLMGLDDSYILPDRYNDAYHLTGDGVVVPVVRHLANFLLQDLLPIERGRRKVS